MIRLKQAYPHLAIKALCELFGKTRHAYYDRQWRNNSRHLEDDIVLQFVMEIRSQLPCVGTRKLQFMLNPMLQEHGIQIGRDYLFDLLTQHKLLIRVRRRTAITTNSRHWMRKYNNMITDLTVDSPEQLWVSDITYIRMTNEFAYLSLITDAYSRKIVGFNLRRDLSTQGCLGGLQMAITARTNIHHQLIHHSDRGSQYCCKEYVDLLTENKIAISMTQNGDPYENALAERMNGIIKKEFKLYSSSLTLEETKQRVATSINSYNTIRPHGSCDYLTPQQAHQTKGPLKKRWKKD
ncbi:MAG: IS3 family transposase [Chryseolinea sp.]